jgi:hypothetical protein
VLGFSLSLQEILTQNPDASLVLSGDVDARNMVNTGFILLRNDAFGLKVLREWWAQDHTANEQAAFNRMWQLNAPGAASLEDSSLADMHERVAILCVQESEPTPTSLHKFESGPRGSTPT